MAGRAATVTQARLHQERWRLLRQVSAVLDRPMTLLAFVWLALTVWDLTRGLSGFLARLNTILWALFILHFAVELVIAPDRLAYLRKNWLTAVSLALPALRVFRALRAFRAVRAAR